MELSRLQRRGEYEWAIAPYGKMRVPAVLFASENLIRAMDEKVYETEFQRRLVLRLVDKPIGNREYDWYFQYLQF